MRVLFVWIVYNLHFASTKSLNIFLCLWYCVSREEGTTDKLEDPSYKQKGNKSVNVRK